MDHLYNKSESKKREGMFHAACFCMSGNGNEDIGEELTLDGDFLQ